MLDKALHTSALIFVHSLYWKPSHHMHSKMSSVAGLEQVLHKVSLALLLSFSGDELANRFVFPACQVTWRLPDDDLHLIVAFDIFKHFMHLSDLNPTNCSNRRTSVQRFL